MSALTITADEITRLALLGPAGWTREEQAAVLDTMRRQGEQIAAALKIHKADQHPSRGQLCFRCFEPYPCPTARALGVDQ